MDVVLSNTSIKGLKPKEKPYEIRDSKQTGLMLRVQPTGLMTYYIEYGRGKRYKIGRHPEVTPQIARDKAIEVLGKAIKGDDPNEAKREARQYTYEQFIEKVYKPWASTNIRTHKDTVSRLLKSFSDFKSKQLHEITPWLVEKWRSGRLKAGKKPATVNRELADLKSCLQKGVEWGILKVHPIKEVKLSRVDHNVAPRYLSEDEETKLIKAIDAREARLVEARDSGNAWRRQRGYKLLPDLSPLPYADHLKPLFLLSLNTGMRRGEVFHLKWSHVDLEAKWVTVDGLTAKSGKTRHIPLNQTAALVLKQWQEQCPAEQVYVFENDCCPFNNVNKAWKTVWTESSIAHFRWHDIRHTFASRLVMAGVDLNTVRELLGHSNYEMTLRYAHLAPEHKANAVERLVKHG